ncbi:diguanylate cyclase [Haliea sp. E1-2-M8]|uniref:sensor domain-containing diguanylate cyclase n=1 Tax=Haliea sp. E1-2-M8 TaxID=3064706 RepID=UPI0027240D1A|nr:sensor domain-containing diguanylate cyclase [Haliea sp. E1-2-M8]MDO8863681.1 diguanylate cyclase [Haliea sp. E1-2-M8]
MNTFIQDPTAAVDWAGYSLTAPGEIQPYGCLLCFTRDFKHLLVASSNCPDLLGLNIHEALVEPSRSLRNVGLEQLLEALSRWGCETQRLVQEMNWNCSGDVRPFQITAWAIDDRVVVECEPLPLLSQPRVLAQTNTWLRELAAAEDSASLFKLLSQGVRELTGFDRVLVFEMQEEGCATVAAEHMAAGVTSVLGNWVPSYEFPPRIREAFEQNPTRLIADAGAASVALVTSGHPLSQMPLDLGHGNLRAIAPVHRRSLIRRGVRAGLYLTITDTQGLRGLVVCHAKDATPVSPLIRDACSTLAQMASQRLAFIELRAHTRFERRLLESRTLTGDRLSGIKEPEQIVESHGAQWLDLLGSTGVALVADRQATVVGAAPAAEALFAVRRQLIARHHRDEAWFTDRLQQSVLADIEGLVPFGGLLAARLPSTSPPGWLLFFREETPRQLHWVSDPLDSKSSYSALALSDLSSLPTPAVVSVDGGTSPWLPAEIKAAADLAEDLAVALNARRISGLADQLEEQRSRFAALARVDGLTAIWNRYYTDEVIEKEIAAAVRYGRPCSVILFDVDHFKLFNDRWGHAVGDKVLKAIADTVGLTVRDSDHLGRWGGEEFLIIAGNSTFQDAFLLAERVRLSVAGVQLDNLDPVTVSLGVAEWAPDDDRRTLVAKADSALYRAKAAGRNCVAA